MADVEKRIGFKSIRVEAALQSKSFKVCDAEISELKSDYHELSCELAILQKEYCKAKFIPRKKENQNRNCSY